MDEAGAPLLERLRAQLPDLGEDYLRLPEPAAPAALRASAPMPEPEQTLPAPPLATPAAPSAPSAPLRDAPLPDMPSESVPSTPDWLQRQEPTLTPFAAPFWPEPAYDQGEDSAQAAADAPASRETPRGAALFPPCWNRQRRICHLTAMASRRQTSRRRSLRPAQKRNRSGPPHGMAPCPLIASRGRCHWRHGCINGRDGAAAPPWRWQAPRP